MSRSDSKTHSSCCAYIAVGGTLFVVASCASLYVAVEFFGPGYKWKANSFLRQMKSTTTHTELQEWAVSEIARYVADTELEAFLTQRTTECLARFMCGSPMVPSPM